MFAARRQVSLHADGPRAIGNPTLGVYWFADLIDGAEPVSSFHDADLYLGGATWNLRTEALLATWLDALLAVAAAVEA